MARTKKMFEASALYKDIQTIDEICCDLDEWVKLIQNNQIEGDIDTYTALFTLTSAIRTLAQLSISVNAYGRIQEDKKKLDKLQEAHGIEPLRSYRPV